MTIVQYIHDSPLQIQVADVVESSFQLRNFAEIAVKLPKLSSRKKPPGLGTEMDSGYKSTSDLRTLSMRWPTQILRVQKSAVNARPSHQPLARTVKLSRAFVFKQKQELLIVDTAHPQPSQLPLAINKYIRPGKQSPKALLYYKPKSKSNSQEKLKSKTQQEAKKPSAGYGKRPMAPLQLCCGSFCKYDKIAVW